MYFLISLVLITMYEFHNGLICSSSHCLICSSSHCLICSSSHCLICSSSNCLLCWSSLWLEKKVPISLVNKYVFKLVNLVCHVCNSCLTNNDMKFEQWEKQFKIYGIPGLKDRCNTSWHLFFLFVLLLLHNYKSRLLLLPKLTYDDTLLASIHIIKIIIM